jgi:uncharacterized GH25 family protein
MQKISSTVQKVVVLVISVLFASIANAHFSWVYPLKTIAQVGETVDVQLATGHAFPVSEQGPAVAHLKAFAQPPSGDRKQIKPVQSEKYLLVSVPIEQEGLYTVCFDIDRGIISKTPEGWKSGGTDTYPDAVSSFNYYASSLAHIATSSTFYQKSELLGLKCELTCIIKDKDVILHAFQNGRPLAGMEISLLQSGKEESVPLGKTDASGQLVCTGKKLDGPVLFVGTYRKAALDGKNYKEDYFRSTLYLKR